ncbi:hypothetical protein RclHR1_10020005 [Rhizophagus clarus]|uniref:Uncharacterized protein n=1 Tax=Rhizophagus clarus TaxID=94130 RepID=A0A2Z6QEW4_9GLOM|nr:hypothetical protein RclHR1_10020005 [Rhizophagus clarus]
MIASDFLTQKAEEVVNTLSLVIKNNLLAKVISLYRIKGNWSCNIRNTVKRQAFECYQYCGSITNDSRALYYTGLYLWRGYVRMEEDEFDDIKAKKSNTISPTSLHLNNADAQYELVTLYYKKHIKLFKRSVTPGLCSGWK